MRRSSSSIICRTPAPSCMTISRSPRISSSVTVWPANGCPGGQARITSSWKNGSKTTPRWRRAAPTTPSSRSRSATRSTTVCVSKTASEMLSAGFRPWNSQSSCASTIPPGPGRRADLERSAELVAFVAADLGDELLLEREQPLGAAVEPQAGLGRLDPPARAVEELRPEPLLERAHLKADGGLRHPEPLGGLREAAPLDDRAEGCELPRIHKPWL